MSRDSYFFNRNRLNIDRFARMDSEGDAYWLGFLMADGFFMGQPEGFGIVLAAADADHLHKFAAFLGWRRPIRVYPVAPSPSGKASLAARVHVRNRPLTDSLIRLGLHSAKTWTVRPWDGPADLMRHFWRGCFDGDGALFFQPGTGGAKRERAVASYSGNEAMVAGFAAFVRGHTGRSGCIERRPAVGKKASAEGRELHVVKWGGNLVCKAIAGLLYEGCTVALDRKHETARRLSAYADPFRFRNVTRAELLALYAEHGSWSAAARAVGTHNTLLGHHARRHGITPEELKTLCPH